MVAVSIKFDVSAQSTLDWKLQLKQAEELVKEGKLLLFELNLGLETVIESYFLDEACITAIEFALEHFVTTVCEPFSSHVTGILLFCADKPKIPSEILKHFAAFFPDAPPLFLRYEDDGLYPCFEVLKGLCDENLEHFKYILQGKLFDRFPHLFSSSTICLVLPKREDPQFDKVLDFLHQQEIFFRVVPEYQITTAWEGVNYFIAFSDSLTRQGYRKLLGFCAAGGTVIPIGQNTLSFPHIAILQELQKEVLNRV